MNRDDKEIHALRVETKHLRAQLRLLKKFSPPAARNLQTSIRDIARELSPHRDQAVCSKWLARHGLPVTEKPLPPLDLSRLKNKLHKNKETFQRLAAEKVPKPKLKKELVKSFEKVKKAKRKAAKDPKDDHFHEWRKRAKDLLYQLEFLGAPEKKTKKLKKLTQILGRAQDSALVQHELRLAIAKKEKKKLQKKALQLG